MQYRTIMKMVFNLMELLAIMAAGQSNDPYICTVTASVYGTTLCIDVALRSFVRNLCPMLCSQCGATRSDEVDLATASKRLETCLVQPLACDAFTRTQCGGIFENASDTVEAQESATLVRNVCPRLCQSCLSQVERLCPPNKFALVNHNSV